MISYRSGYFDDDFKIGDELKVREIKLVDKGEVDVKYTSCFLLPEVVPRMYCLVGYESKGESKIKVLRQKKEESEGGKPIFSENMEIHADLTYLFRNGYASIDWITSRYIKYLQRLRYVDYAKMEYGECPLDIKTFSNLD